MSSDNNIKEKIENLPPTPGVYFFKDAASKILYIGKATSLRDRVKSYFSKDLYEARGPWIEKMRGHITDIEVTETDSALEALLLEAYLIKKHQPRFNSKEKDDKSFAYVVITKDRFPVVSVMRERDLLKRDDDASIAYIYGPFPQGKLLREALKIIRKIFPFRDEKCVPAEDQKRDTPKPCFNYHIGLCPGVCTGEISASEYRRRIMHIRFFFEGRKREIVQRLTKDMNKAVKGEDFETAATIRNRLHALDHIRDVSLLTDSFFEERRNASGMRIEGYDVAHTAGSHVVGVMVAVDSGEPLTDAYRTFRIKDDPGNNDIKALKEIIRRRMRHPEWGIPDYVVVDGGIAHKNAAEKILKVAGYTIPVIAVSKDANHRPHRYKGNTAIIRAHKDDIVTANMEAHRFALSYHKRLRDKM